MVEGEQLFSDCLVYRLCKVTDHVLCLQDSMLRPYAVTDLSGLFLDDAFRSLGTDTHWLHLMPAVTAHL